ncbi:hypothetical protein B0T21DRAFT_380118 [Apiosordaria backusii]|uniref:Uncharacterized protein n=1 Tax=Apiosordaria backusii TaxID=314023 RepID=A0AA40EZK9_9PEZI|nr:hypothetical protein B0T21DRAFT_380118 [Apiosordaria backusii]
MMVPVFSATLVAAILPLVATLPALSALTAYTIPPAAIKSAMEADSDCIFPVGFNITNFKVFTPAPGNNRSQILSFDFFDDSTSISTSCAFNETSKNVAPFDFTPRYPCDDYRITFIWNNQTQGLSMIEKVCPDVLTTPMEASGWVGTNDTLRCLETSQNNTYGPGLDCISFNKYVAKYTSMQPTPW